MSKQPRGNVRVGVGNTVGKRVSNIFADVKKFQSKYQDAQEKASTSSYSQEMDLQRTARMSAIQAIRSISNWLYWKTPNAGGSAQGYGQYLIRTAHKSTGPDIEKLRAAVAARKKQERENSGTRKRTPSTNSLNLEEYWKPLPQALPAASTPSNSYSKTVSEPSLPAKEWKKSRNEGPAVPVKTQRDPIEMGIPIGAGVIASAIVRLQGGGPVGGIEEHVGGSLALQIVNSSWLPVILTGITWYMIGVAVVGFVEAIRSRKS